VTQRGIAKQYQGLNRCPVSINQEEVHQYTHLLDLQFSSGTHAHKVWNIEKSSRPVSPRIFHHIMFCKWKSAMMDNASGWRKSRAVAPTKR